MAYGWPQLLGTAESDGTALTASTAATSILPTHAVTAIPANTLRVGNMFRILASGRASTVVTTPGTLTFDVRFGSVTAWASGAIPLNIVAKTNETWWLDIQLTVRAIGGSTTANMIGVGQWTSASVIGSPASTAGGNGTLNLPTTSPAVGTGFDSTASQLVDLRATWSISNADSIQLHQYSLWHLTAQ